ncbi:MAG: GNAT family N-acetyltransferase [Ilumatobacter sp.]|nr:GNAT family N-acetyltransferase [Ilumatobacter sp.]
MIDLERLDTRKLPLSYGTERLRLTLNDSRYTEQVVKIRNDPRLNEWIHHDPLTPEAHDQFLQRELERRDALNFAILVDNEFAGVCSLRDIRGTTAEWARLVMPDRVEVRKYAVTVGVLFLSLGYEVLGRASMYCRILEGNRRTRRYVEKIGWRPDPGYDSEIPFDGERRKLLGYSLSSAEWPEIFAAHRDLLAGIVS